jgi:hypothetical protein
MTTESTSASVGREPELLGQTVVLIGGSAQAVLRQSASEP